MALPMDHRNMFSVVHGHASSTGLAPSPSGVVPGNGALGNLPPDLNHIYKGIWLGSRTALRSATLNDKNINDVLNTSTELLNPNTPIDWADLQMNGINIQHLQWYDNHQQQIFPLTAEIFEAMSFLHECVEDNRQVLVNCQMGISRSSSMVISYLIIYQHFGFREALALVRASRPMASPNANFYDQLCMLESAVATGAPLGVGIATPPAALRLAAAPAPTRMETAPQHTPPYGSPTVSPSVDTTALPPRSYSPTMKSPVLKQPIPHKPVPQPVQQPLAHKIPSAQPILYDEPTPPQPISYDKIPSAQPIMYDKAVDPQPQPIPYDKPANPQPIPYQKAKGFYETSQPISRQQPLLQQQSLQAPRDSRQQPMALGMQQQPNWGVAGFGQQFSGLSISQPTTVDDSKGPSQQSLPTPQSMYYTNGPRQGKATIDPAGRASGTAAYSAVDYAQVPTQRFSGGYSPENPALGRTVPASASSSSWGMAATSPFMSRAPVGMAQSYSSQHFSQGFPSSPSSAATSSRNKSLGQPLSFHESQAEAPMLSSLAKTPTGSALSLKDKLQATSSKFFRKLGMGPEDALEPVLTDSSAAEPTPLGARPSPGYTPPLGMHPGGDPSSYM
uniref:protein-tyrosine-phosphatase n=1 Tax=Eutreptiella gymnastica TaxID=73025 RepID=A0A7S1I7L6_9EUGL